LPIDKLLDYWPAGLFCGIRIFWHPRINFPHGPAQTNHPINGKMF
jgi:hypothetical protein